MKQWFIKKLRQWLELKELENRMSHDFANTNARIQINDQKIGDLGLEIAKLSETMNIGVDVNLTTKTSWAVICSHKHGQSNVRFVDLSGQRGDEIERFLKSLPRLSNKYIDSPLTFLKYF